MSRILTSALASFLRGREGFWLTGHGMSPGKHPRPGCGGGENAFLICSLFCSPSQSWQEQPVVREQVLPAARPARPARLGCFHHTRCKCPWSPDCNRKASGHRSSDFLQLLAEPKREELNAYIWEALWRCPGLIGSWGLPPRGWWDMTSRHPKVFKYKTAQGNLDLSHI